MNKMIAILPARKFDYKITNKNLLPFHDTSLFQHKINQLKKVDLINEIIVCSDSDEILELAEKNNVGIYKREPSAEDQSFSELVYEISTYVKKSDILWANVCTPLISENRYEDAIKVYNEKKKEGYDSLISVYPFKRFVIDENGPVNFKKGMIHKESAKLSQLYFLVSGIFIAYSTNMAKWKYNWGNIPYKYELTEEESIEIKDLKDLKIAELLFAKGD